MRLLLAVLCCALVAGCDDDTMNPDGGGDDAGAAVDGGGSDGGGSDGGGMDAGDAVDGGGSDGGGSDGGGSDAGARPDGATSCTDDSQCAMGTEWCEGGACVACDNSGLLCDIACSPDGWSTYERNGCFPCDCGPPPGCRSDADCADSGGTCYPGRFCWCDPTRPECCLGNTCGAAGCTPPSPAGCRRTGCPRGQSCSVAPAGMCTPSSCSCAGGSWACSRDCGGGSCM